jgi:opacity protein-like surface antigen
MLLAGTAVLIGPFLIESGAKADPNCDRYGPGLDYIFDSNARSCIAQDRFSFGYTAGILGSNASAKFGDDSSSSLMGYGGSQGFQAGYTHTWADGWQAGVTANYVWANLDFSGVDGSTRVNSFGGVSAKIGPTIFGGINPYVTAGAAFTRDRFSFGDEMASANLFGVSAGGGVEFPVAGSFSAFFEYRYYWFGNNTPFDGGPSFTNNYSTVMAGFNKNLSLSSNGVRSLWPTYSPYDPPPQLNFYPYIGGQLGGGFDNFQINGMDSDVTRSIHGSSWAAGGFIGVEAPTSFSGFSTRYELDYQATGARATLETSFDSTITKSICGETSANFLVAYRPPTYQNWDAYGGVGFGSVDVTVRTEHDSDHQYGLAFNAIAGLETNIGRDWTVGVRNTWVSVEPLVFTGSNVKTYADFVGATLTYKPFGLGN